jgi:hypothetical protein
MQSPEKEGIGCGSNTFARNKIFMLGAVPLHRHSQLVMNESGTTFILPCRPQPCKCT